MKTIFQHMTPVIPDLDAELEGLVVSLLERVAILRGGIHPVTCDTMSKLVETMNSYYSNLIEGHYTTPADIDRALLGEYSADPAKRELQVESVAHIDTHQFLVKRFRPTDVPESPCSRSLSDF